VSFEVANLSGKWFKIKKKYCNIKPGRFNFYDPRTVAYLQALFLHHSSTISLLLYMDVTVLSRVANTVRGKKIHLSISLSLPLSVFMYIRIHVIAVTLTDKIKDNH
jgi:hypothetical protein